MINDLYLYSALCGIYETNQQNKNLIITNNVFLREFLCVMNFKKCEFMLR